VSETPTEGKEVDRRTWLASALMGIGLLASYGTLASQFLGFLLPDRATRRRRIFVGTLGQFPEGSVRTIRDLEGNGILVRHTAAGIEAFSSVCPHLGCKVHWEGDNERFFCPCHKGVFSPDGAPVSGPPADAGQSLSRAPIVVDGDVVYLEVKDPGRRRRG
jgi:Rieske Fe-S protein